MSTTKNNSFDDISSQLCEFLHKNILAPEIKVSPETELASIGVDSFSLMELVLFIERQFGLVLPAEALTAENIASVKTLTTYCLTQLKQTNG